NTFDNSQVTKKPLYYRGDILLKYKISDVALIEYTSSLRDEDIKTDRAITSNQNSDINSNLNSEDLFLKQRLLYTKKISANKALQLSALYTTNAIQQNYTLTPSVFDVDYNGFDSQYVNSKTH